MAAEPIFDKLDRIARKAYPFMASAKLLSIAMPGAVIVL